MKAVPLAMVTLTLLALSACAGAPVPPALPTSPASQSQPSDTDASSPAPGEASGSENAAAGVTSRGFDSPECATVTDVLGSATDFVNMVDEGVVTQADFDEAFTGAAIDDLPADAVPTFTATKAAAAKLVGLSGSQAATATVDLAAAMLDFTQVAEKICF